jgi:hypothetical protein
VSASVPSSRASFSRHGPWVPAGLLGWIRVDDIDSAVFAQFLLINGVVLALYEAIPEELALRGSMRTNLRDGWGLVIATLLTTAAFPFIGAVVAPVKWAVIAALGGGSGELRIFPAGNDPAVYVVQLVLFGLALVAARRLPLPGALFTAMAFHWAQLSVTRALFGGRSWAPSGLTIMMVEPDAIVLVLVHIVLAGCVLIGLRLFLQRRLGAFAPSNGVPEMSH